MAHVNAKPLGGKILTPSVILMLFVAGAGIYFLFVRYIYGIGAVSNLSNYMPWGIWKVINVIVGAALVCGGYACAFTVYLFNQGHYHRYVRPALLISLLGYSFAGFSLFYDVGRYWGLFNFLIPKYWQGNSVLFEVGLCVMTYIGVLSLEIAPAIIEKFSHVEGRLRVVLDKLYAFLDRFLFLIISLGILLPTMHQSGLGGLAVVMGQKISPLWQSPLISLHHLISCMAMGYGCVIVTEMLVSHDYKETQHMEILSQLAKVMFMIMFVFLVLRMSEVLRSGAMALAFKGNLDSISFWTEMLLMVGGLWCVRNDQVRMKPNNIFLGSCLIMAAGSLYRLNVYIIGFHPVPGVTYFPSVPELSISLGMVCLQLIFFIMIIKTFPIIAKERR
ncbi:MAG: Ni/Fe-hydrogenase cytochrome b subunit [Proteobacteria bacterium]|nr:Ni/Fe-hydrogenase cytochrome b subunit [Pseudomonadota bacterium]